MSSLSEQDQMDWRTYSCTEALRNYRYSLPQLAYMEVTSVMMSLPVKRPSISTMLMSLVNATVLNQSKMMPLGNLWKSQSRPTRQLPLALAVWLSTLLKTVQYRMPYSLRSTFLKDAVNAPIIIPSTIASATQVHNIFHRSFIFKNYRQFNVYNAMMMNMFMRILMK